MLYIVPHFSFIEKIIEDGANVWGYLHLAPKDNFEWRNSFSKKFGPIGVNLKTKERELRPSALILKEIISKKGVPSDMKWINKIKI